MRKPVVARDIMVAKTVNLSPNEHVCDGLSCLLKHSITGAPVTDDQGKFLGVFSEKRCMEVLRLAAACAPDDKQRQFSKIAARDFMSTKLVTLSPKMDVVDAIGLLLKNRISGAPVLDERGHFMGVLSERYSMRFLVEAAYEQLPTSDVGPLMNTDLGRVIAPELGLLDIADIFLRQYFRRLIVLEQGKLLGLISRRDVLRAGQALAMTLRKYRPPADADGDTEVSGDDTDSVSLEKLRAPFVATFMDTTARTITEETDLLNIAQIFLTTNYRRLPVLRDGKLVGQLSRRDILQAIYDLMAVTPNRKATLLYLSTLVDPKDLPFSK